MASFAYTSLTGGGEVRSGVVVADDRAGAVRQLLDRGETATRLESVGDGGDSGGAAVAAVAAAPKRPAIRRANAGDKPTGLDAGVNALLGRFSSARQGRPSLKKAELAQLVRELATALEAGLPLMNALRTVRKQAAGRALPVILDHLIERVEAGDPLYAAARDYGPPFDEMTIGMLRAADASGEMSVIMHQLADLLDRAVELRREVMGATFYPAIVFVLLIASVLILVTVLVPRLIEPMQSESGMALPWPTAVLIAFANFMESWWWLLGLAILGSIVGWVAWTSNPVNRLTVDRLMLKIPVLGRLLRDVAVARFTRTLGTLTAAGLPILDALRITKNTLGNAALVGAISEVEDQVTAGKSLATPLERSGLFPPLLIQVVNLGERSGKLDGMLMHAASAFDRTVNTSLTLFTKALPPFLLIIMAGLGGFVLAAILLPMLQMQSMVG